MPHREIQIQAAPGLWPPTWPMGLTMLRLLLLPVFLGAIVVDADLPGRPHRWLGIAVFAVMAITDKLDGYLARRLNQTTRLGAILDPVADKLLIACSVTLLSFERIAPEGVNIPLWVVLAVYGKDLVIALGVVALLSLVGKVTIMPRPLGRLSTVLQLSMVLAVLITPNTPAWRPGWEWFVYVLWWLVSIVAIMAAVDYVILGASQYRSARPKPQNAVNETEDQKSQVAN